MFLSDWKLSFSTNLKKPRPKLTVRTDSSIPKLPTLNMPSPPPEDGGDKITAPKETTYTDPSGAIFSMYTTRGLKIDSENVENWQEGSQSILILYASVLLSPWRYPYTHEPSSSPFSDWTFLFFGGIFNCHELPYLYQDPNVITQSLLTQISQQLSNTNHSISVTGPLPKVLSLLPLWQYLSTPSGTSASCSVSVAHLWLHFCNIGRAGTSRLFNDITHRMSTPTSESTFFEAHTSSAPSGFPSSCRLFFSYLSSCSSLDSSVLPSKPITLSHLSPSPLSDSASLRIWSSL